MASSVDSHSPAEVVASVKDVSINWGDCVRQLRVRGAWQPLVLQTLAKKVAATEARRLGLMLSAEELQQAADRFRKANGLCRAASMTEWLRRQRLQPAEFEAAIEDDLLFEKLREHLPREQILLCFESHPGDYARAWLRRILVAHEDLANELITQHQDGADFAELASQHSQHTFAANRGAVDIVFRRQLPDEMAKAVFASRAGAVVGPFATPQGFLLLKIESLRPAELDSHTAAAIGHELFEAWLNEQLEQVVIA